MMSVDNRGRRPASGSSVVSINTNITNINTINNTASNFNNNNAAAAASINTNGNTTGQSQLHPNNANAIYTSSSNMTKRASRGSALSTSSRSTQSTSGEKLRDSGDSQQLQWRAVRTLPTWVQRYEEEDDLTEEPPLLPPPLAHKGTQRSIYDNIRENTPVTMKPTLHEGSRWKSFVQASANHPFDSSQDRFDEERAWGDNGLSGPWLANKREENSDDDAENAKNAIFGISAKRRQIWYKRFQIMLLNNPMVPLTFRAIIWILSLCALSFSCSIYRLSSHSGIAQLPSTTMAIIVDAVAMVYIIYITYDEYSGKPLGLRSPKAKIRLVMLDLFFIIFDSANLSLAFDTLYDVKNSCASLPTGSGPSNSLDFVTNHPICSRQKALASFLFLALVAWVGTFTVSVFRLVERVSRTAG